MNIYNTLISVLTFIYFYSKYSWKKMSIQNINYRKRIFKIKIFEKGLDKSIVNREISSICIFQ